MIKLPEIRKELKMKHKEWCEKNVKIFLEIICNITGDEVLQEALNNFDKLILGEINDSKIVKFKGYDLEKKIDFEVINRINDKLKKENKEKIINEYNNALKILKYDCFKIKEKIKIEDLKKKIKDLNKKIDTLNDLKGKKRCEFFSSIFNYDEFSKENKEWNRHELLVELGITVCPYCNRQYITSYKKDELKKTTADLDHFYPKSFYPYLGLNIYNFIPSCQICNRNFKKAQKMEEAIYPYKEEFGSEGRFIINLKNNSVIIPRVESDFSVSIVSKNKKIKKSIGIFKLKEVYENSHNKYIIDMLKNFEEYPEAHLKSIGELFLIDKNNESVVNEKIENELKEILKRPYKFKIDNQEPLFKLTEDILEEFGIKL